jgi:transposase
VTDPAFRSGEPFFDRRDLVQVKYEMLRRVHEEGRPVSRAAADFGLSRPSFYAAQASFLAAGLAGLVPQRPGPRRAHKLSSPIVEALAATLAADPSLSSADLVAIVNERFGTRVHRRSVERALERRKRGRPTRP